MNKNILLAGILSLAAIAGTVTVYNKFIMPRSPEKSERTVASKPSAAGENTESPKQDIDPGTLQAEASAFVPVLSEGENTRESFPVRESPEYKAVFSSLGGRLVSLKLKNYKDPSTGGFVDMVISGSTDEAPLELHLGNFRTPGFNMPMNVEEKENSLVFKGTYSDSGGRKISVEKTITFAPGEYLFKVDLKIKALEGVLPVSSDGAAASLTFGPLLGPTIEKLDGKQDYRYFYLRKDKKKSYFKPAPEGYTVMSGITPYLGLDSRYFTSFILPEDDESLIVFDALPAEGITPRMTYGLTWKPSPAESSTGGELQRTLYLYLGPKDGRYLSLYDSSDKNRFGLHEQNLQEILGQTRVLQNLSNVMKTVLKLLHRIIPNYGISIILLALLLEIFMIPLTSKAARENARVALIYPEIRALKNQYGNDKSRLNQKISELFRQKGIKPKPGSRSLILHLPIFILLYYLFSVSIDFRMAVFIPGWIPDISRPESIWSFSPFIMPITGWTDIRLLPVILLLLSLYQSRKVQPPEETLTAMRNMSILMPIILFVIVYNMPAGAVLFWITHTSASVVQHLLIKRRVFREAGAA